MKLFIGAHIDDIEIFAGGTLLKTEGEKHCVIFSPCEESIPNGFGKEITKEELDKSMKYAGVSYELHNFPVRHFPRHRQDILEKLVELRKEHNPETVYCISDSHQDHHTIGDECIRAFRNCGLINFGNDLNGFLDYNYIVSLTEEDVKRKLKMISFYKSQVIKGRLDENVLINKMKYHGRLAGVEYAELLKIVRIKA